MKQTQEWLTYYMPTTYVDLCATRKGEGSDWFRIKEGDKVQVRDTHNLDSNEWSEVIETDRQYVTFWLVEKGCGYPIEVEQSKVFRVRRKMKNFTVGATYPCNWGGGNLIPFKFTANTLRVMDMKLKIKWTNVDGDRMFSAYASHDGKKYEEYAMVSGMIWNDKDGKGSVEAWNGEWNNINNGYAHTTRECNHWADAIVRVLANIY